MMKLALALSFLFSMSAFAVDTISCTVGETEVLVSVAKPNEASVTSESNFSTFVGDEGKVAISSRFNGTSSGLKPGASGKYTLSIFLEVSSTQDSELKNTAASLNFSASFPNSQTILFARSSLDESPSDKEEFFSVPVTCVEVK